MRETYTGKIKSLNNNEFFVFGSNTEGRHGKGAAELAKKKFGAIYGEAYGLQGQSYAIVIKNLQKKNHPSISIQKILLQVYRLYLYATLNHDKKFYIAYSGTGKNLNGYSNEQMSLIFALMNDKLCDIPKNIIFEHTFNEMVFNHRKN